MSHKTLIGAELHQPFHYQQETDPGAVGAGLWWFKKSAKAVKYRNDTNTGWVSVLVSTPVGDQISTYHQVPPGTTWSGFLSIYNAASPGDTIVLANETINQTSQLNIFKSIKIIGHPGGLSELLLPVDYSSSVQIGLYTNSPTTPIDGLVLRNFKITHTRNATNRILAIDLGNNHISNVEIDHIHFNNITSDCFIIRPYQTEAYVSPPGPPNGYWEENPITTKNILFHDNLITEVYEAVLNIHAGSVANVMAWNNTVTVSQNHPLGSVQYPLGFELNIEEGKSYCDNIIFAYNTLTATGLNSAGLLGLMSHAGGTTSGIRFRNIQFINNVVTGFNYNIDINAINDHSDFPGSLMVANNICSAANASDIRCYPYAGGGGVNLGHANDRISFINNSAGVSIDRSNLPNPSLLKIDVRNIGDPGDPYP